MAPRHLLAGALLAGGAVDIVLGAAVGEAVDADAASPVGVLLVSVGAISMLAGVLAGRGAARREGPGG